MLVLHNLEHGAPIVVFVGPGVVFEAVSVAMAPAPVGPPVLALALEPPGNEGTAQVPIEATQVHIPGARFVARESVAEILTMLKALMGGGSGLVVPRAR